MPQLVLMWMEKRHRHFGQGGFGPTKPWCPRVQPFSDSGGLAHGAVEDRGTMREPKPNSGFFAAPLR